MAKNKLERPKEKPAPAIMSPDKEGPKVNFANTLLEWFAEYWEPRSRPRR